MRILFASGHPYLPQLAGGLQSNTHELAGELIELGHDVAVLSALTKAGWTGLQARFRLKLAKSKVAKDYRLGYATYRSWSSAQALAETIRMEKPDVIVSQPGSVVELAAEAERVGIPVVVYFHNVEFKEHAGALETLQRAKFVANSQFTASRYKNTYGIDCCVICPLFQPERYRTRSTRESVLFVNPRPSKGLDRALEVAAAMPDVPFDFVESWTLGEAEWGSLRHRVRQLRNIHLHRRRKDMRPFYGRAKIVLVPSVWEETWGRVASEAHYSGIPVVATRIGGLPEAVGPGGVLLDPGTDTADWVTAMRRLWSENDYYMQLSGAAASYSGRDQINPEKQVRDFLGVLDSALAVNSPKQTEPSSLTLTPPASHA